MSRLDLEIACPCEEDQPYKNFIQNLISDLMTVGPNVGRLNLQKDSFAENSIDEHSCDDSINDMLSQISVRIQPPAPMDLSNMLSSV